MIQDIWTVTRKDLHEYVASLYTGPWSVLLAVIMVTLAAAFFSLQREPWWRYQHAVLLVLGWLPLLLVANMVADSFTGERDRHTLEPLLATRLSSCAILLGKIAAATLYGWGILLVCIFIAVVTPAVTGSLSPYLSPIPLVWLTGLGLLAAALAATTGALLSIPAATARQAQQYVIVGMFALIPLLVLAPTAFQQLLPAPWQSALTDLLASARSSALFAATTLALFAVDAVLVAVASALFRRSRLSPH